MSVLVTNLLRHFDFQSISHEPSRPVPISPISLWGFNMAAVDGSLEEEALKRRERLKALRKKSGLPSGQVTEHV